MSNRYTPEQIEAKYEEFGEQAARGLDVQVQSLIFTAELAHQGLLSMDKGTHGPEIDDATHYAGLYFKKQMKASHFDHKTNSNAKLTSCHRTMIRFGMIEKFGPSEPINSLDLFHREWKKLNSDKSTRKQIKDAANATMTYARAQLKTPHLIKGDELKSFCYKPTPEAKEVEDYLLKIKKDLIQLYQGKAASGTLADQSTQVEHAIKSIERRLSLLAKEKMEAEGLTEVKTSKRLKKSVPDQEPVQEMGVQG